MSSQDETLAELEARIVALCWGGELAQLPLPRAMRIQGDCLGDNPGDRELFLSYRVQRLLDEEAQGTEGSDATGRGEVTG